MAEHAVIVRFEYGSTDLDPLFQLEDQLEEVISQAEVGEYDGNEMAVSGSNGFLYMYGPDADKLFAAVRPILAETDIVRNAVATLRYGPAADDVRRVEVPIGL